MESSGLVGLSGCTGFIGAAILARLSKAKVVVFARKPAIFPDYSSRQLELNGSFDFGHSFEGIDTFIHGAALVHSMSKDAIGMEDEYRTVNIEGTLNLAKQAADSGVKRFIFLSSIKVNGESTNNRKAFTPFDEPHPVDAYASSKANAEIGLRKIAAETGMEVVIIRPPLVYGPGVKANFSAMMKLAKKNLPLPFGAINNKRSLVALDNLVDLIITCIGHPKAANQTFLVSDDHDVSTAELLKMMTRAAGKEPRLAPVPVVWLQLAAKITGQQSVIERLCGNLQVDISHTKEALDWVPPLSLEEGIRHCFIKDDLC